MKKLLAKNIKIGPRSLCFEVFLFDFFEILWYNIYTKMREENKIEDKILDYEFALEGVKPIVEYQGWVPFDAEILHDDEQFFKWEGAEDEDN